MRNRLGLGPINPGFFQPDGSSSAAVHDFYREYAGGGLGLVYIGGVAVCPAGRSNAGTLVMQGSGAVAGVRSIADAVHCEGAALAVQLMHSGRQASAYEVGWRRIAASPLPCPVYGGAPEEASHAQIGEIVAAFRGAARLAETAGADLVELHAAHGYLLSCFLSAWSNHRSDAYGGSVAGRFRILRETVLAVREAVQVPVGVRVNVAENVAAGGLDVGQAVEGLLPIQHALDFISVSAGVYTRDEDWIIPRRQLGPALWRSEARRLAGALQRPVFLAGNIDTAELANDVVGCGDAHVALMVRSLLADPRLLRKWLSGPGEEAQPCTELLLCKYHSRGQSHLYCPHNGTLRSHLRWGSRGPRLPEPAAG